MRKVQGDARRATRGRRKSGEERGESHQGRSSSSNKINNRVNISLNFCSLQ